MDEKISLQDIIRLLAEKKGMDGAKAETFVKAFFSVIEDALKVDGVVKIKGFGTFKLVGIDSRESVDVNTGQRITIKGHTKITFAPDARLRDEVNKPFSHFEAVALKEGVCFEDLPSPVTASRKEEVGADAPPLPGDDAADAATVPEETLSRPEGDGGKAAAFSPSVEEPGPRESPFPERKKGRTRKGGWEGASAAAVLAVAIAVFLSIRHEATTGIPMATDKMPVASLAESRPAHPAKDTATLREGGKGPAETAVAIDTTRTLITGVRKNAATVIADSTSYVIVGTMATYRLKPGETLTMVSKRFYETKDLWPYLVMHNRDRIRNPHQVPQGILLRIPALRDKPQRDAPMNH